MPVKKAGLKYVKENYFTPEQAEAYEWIANGYYNPPLNESTDQLLDIEEVPLGFQQAKFHMVKGTGGKKNKNNKKPNSQRPRPRRRRRARNDPRTRMIMEEKAPVAWGSRVMVPSPKVSSGGRGIKTVSHRELLCEVSGSVNFSATQIALNPGLESSFPWLSKEALTYEMYKWKLLRFIYVPSCATTKTGNVGLSIDFDCDDAPPTTKMEFMSNMDSVTSSSFESCTYTTNQINFVRQFPNKFVRFGSEVLNTSDQGRFDLGTFLYFTSGQDNTNVIGSIYVEYIVEFFIPFLSSVATSSYGVADWSLTGVDQTHYFGTSATVNGFIVPKTDSGAIGMYVDPTVSFTQLIITGIPIGSTVRIGWRVIGTTLATTPLLAINAGASSSSGTKLNWASTTATDAFAVIYCVATSTTIRIACSALTFATCTSMKTTVDVYDHSVDALTA